ncbi:MAG: single-stranded DNA-binding protein [Oligoflexia bacterium]|nr:single-stranded DNA-binding protein [Oligoflexia bacterium]
MQGFNKVIIVGTLGSDPQIHKSREGKDFASLSLATNRWWRNKDGLIERRTDWHRVTVWGKKANICQTHLKKGAAVCVEGYLSTYEVEEDGKTKRNTLITAEEVNFLTKAPMATTADTIESEVAH